MCDPVAVPVPTRDPDPDPVPVAHQANSSTASRPNQIKVI